MSESHSISLTQASVRFGTTLALEGFAGTFEPGTVSAVIGGDGSGKSTLLRALSGRVPFQAHTSAGLPVPRTEVGYLPATSGVWRNLSVAENVEFVAHTFGLSAATTRARSAHLLERAGLAEAKDRLAGRLSGGMRQKLGVVLATLHSPALVLLDEPTTGVDPISRAEVWSLIAASAAEGATVMFTTTYLDEAERAHQLFLLGDGRLLASGSVADVVQQAPGRIWEAAAARPGARAALRAPRSWRRGGTIYLWDPSPAAAAPPGFRAAIPDLENTSIALLTARHEAAASGPRPHSNARTDVSSRTRASKRPHSQPPVPLGGAGGASGGSSGGGSSSSGSSSGSGSSSNRRATTGPLVEAREVVRRYGDFSALSGVSLSVRPGEIVGLLGGNGAGKTTLMRILLGLETATSGETGLLGRHPSLQSRRSIGYVAQGLGLYPSLSAIANLEFTAAAHRVAPPQAALRFAAAQGPGPTSALPLGTQRQLAYLAATVHDPALVVLDEPTSGMDALARAELWRDLRAAAELGVGTLITTHYMQEAAQCDRLIILTAGRVTSEGATAAIVAGRSSLVVETPRVNAAFAALTAAGIAAVLSGTAIRVPGANRAAVAAALADLGGAVSIEAQPTTLEEAMLLDALTASRAG